MVPRALAVGLIPALWAGLVLAAGPPKPAPVSFRDDVAPILVRSCLGCHNDAKAENGLNLATFASLRRGGKTTGTDFLEPGDASASALIESVRPDAKPRMPYKLPPLDEAEVRTLEAWVNQGAKFDGPSESQTPIASLVDPLKHLPKVALRAGVSDPVTSLAFSPDGKTLAAAVGTRVVLFDLSTGKSRATLAGHPGPVNAVLFTGDGGALVAAGGRAGMFGAVTVWDVQSGTRKTEGRGHADAILGAALSPDGKVLATGSYDRMVVLWDLATAKPSRTLKDHTDSVYAVAFSPDGKTLASAGADRTVKLWDVATGRRGVTLSDATAELYAVAFARGGAVVFAAGVDRTIRAWNVAEKDARLVRSAFAHGAAVLRLVISADGTRLASSGEDRGVKLWDPDTLAPRMVLPAQPDWPLAVALSGDGAWVAVGRYDGSIALFDGKTGKVARTVQTAPAPAVVHDRPALVRNASLNPPSPRGATRGGTVRLTLTGQGVGRATEVFFADPGLNAAIVPAAKADPDRLEVDLTIAKDARIGLHRFGVVTPLGVPGSQTFAVEAFPPVTLAEPDDDPASRKPVPLPATLLGTIDRPGDVDHVRFEATRGQQLVFATTARTLGSSLVGALSVLDTTGRTVAEASASADLADPGLTLDVPRDGMYTLRITDADYGGSGNHFYRVSAGAQPYLTGSFPTGVARGVTTPVEVSGVNLGGVSTVPVHSDEDAGTILAIPVRLPDGSIPVNRRRVVIAEGPQIIESEPNGDAAGAATVTTPGGASGTLAREGDVDHFRFEARKGERLVVEIFARRLGSPADPVLEILDRTGKPVPRAVLRPVAQTEVAFRDHNASSTGIRITKWNNLAMDDVVLIGREVTRIFNLPRNLDDDCQFIGENGRRAGLLGTTPEYHQMGQPIYKVEIHPPGTTFPPGGAEAVVIDYRNDDGGPGFDKDSYLIFDPPSDGPFLARVADARGRGGAGFGYHLVVRRPQPDFEVSVSPEDTNIPRGGTSLVTVSVHRRDGFEGPVDVTAEGLPPGITATPVRVERGTVSALIALSADATAPAYSPPSWKVIARAAADAGDRSAAGSITHELDPAGPRGGRITVIPPPNLKVAARPTRVVIRPGGDATMTLAVERGPAFAGRVPIDVKNLPRGVRVLNIGLNGVLVTETQSERAITLHAEPWVGAVERPFYAAGRAESAGTEHSSAPITLVVEPGPVGAPATASAVR